MRRILKKKFFERQTVTVAKDLLGKYLCRRYRGKTVCRMITETEAYDGEKDKASHASRGRTPRTEVMFGSPGNFYIHMIYGIYYCSNIVCGPENFPAAVLIRGVEGVNGPGRVSRFFKIDKKFNTKPVNRKIGLWIATPSLKERASLRKKFGAGKLKIRNSPRIGVGYAGPVWANKLYRFYIKSDEPRRRRGS